MSDPDPLSPDDDKALGHDEWGFILRICIVVYLGLLLWQAILVTWTP